jgi:hypothetical protein
MIGAPDTGRENSNSQAQAEPLGTGERTSTRKGHGIYALTNAGAGAASSLFRREQAARFQPAGQLLRPGRHRPATNTQTNSMWPFLVKVELSRYFLLAGARRGAGGTGHPRRVRSRRCWGCAKSHALVPWDPFLGRVELATRRRASRSCTSSSDMPSLSFATLGSVTPLACETPRRGSPRLTSNQTRTTVPTAARQRSPPPARHRRDASVRASSSSSEFQFSAHRLLDAWLLPSSVHLEAVAASARSAWLPPER